MITDRARDGQPDPASGLCAACLHARVVTNDRGSRFVLCGRARTDPRFPRYPALPVRACPGYETSPVG